MADLTDDRRRILDTLKSSSRIHPTEPGLATTQDGNANHRYRYACQPAGYRAVGRIVSLRRSLASHTSPRSPA